MRRLSYILILLTLIVVACSRTPHGVIGKGDMAELLADLHTAEGVVDNNQGEYSSDSMKQLLKQSVFAKHGVTIEEFDSSLMWYGMHLKDYIDVYDNVINILEKRNVSMGNAVVQMRGSMSGDSVDVWAGTRYAKLSPRMPSQYVSFEIDADNNSQKGDTYTWRIKLCDEDMRLVRWTIVAEYEDNSTDWYNGSTGGRGWNEVIFAADSTLQLKKLKGYFDVDDGRSPQYGVDNSAKKAATETYIDSISLIRKRLNTDDYRYRARLRHYPAFGK